MLHYLDRAPAELAPPARLAVMALRLWGKDMRNDRCPIGVLRELFTRFGAPGALWPAHHFFYWTLAHAARPLHLGCPCCGRLDDDEAALLSAMFAAKPEVARSALSELVAETALPRAVRLAAMLGSELCAVGLYR